MKKTNDSLYLLVKSMTETEVSNFKKQSSINSSKSQTSYIKLFDVLRSINTFDKEDFLSRVTKKGIKNIPETKNYLYKQLIPFLKDIFIKSSIKNKLLDQISEAEMLQNRGLLNESFKLVREIKEMAKKFEYGNIV